MSNGNDSIYSNKNMNFEKNINNVHFRQTQNN